ncbi:hypothetical protein CXB51_001706 [Gossypium anomalum]|uniref:Peptidase A2 domain-containing protein n=1 Tax=Gossypium anomalum TaxID=47600 RepID=A0A8J5Z677_9ROSI|nr:hypothetical protein CXB51_001706 [Gossypium anomalum]
MLQISDLSKKEAFFSFTDGLKPWAKQELQRRGVQELTNAMMVAESLVELVPRRDRFESSKPNGRGNGGHHKEDKEGHSYYGSGSGSDGGNRKPRNGKRRPNSPKERRGKLRCYFCNGPHMKRDCPKVSTFSAIKKSDEPEEAKPIEEKASRVNSMILFPKKRNGREGLMFVDINIAGRNGSALIDTGASDLFISEKAAKKLGLSIKKLNRKIKTVNSEEGPTVGVVRDVELQIGEWKGKEEFEVIQLDDYDYVLGLNFLDKIQTVLYPWADQIHLVTGPLSKIVVPVYRDMKVGTKVLFVNPTSRGCLVWEEHWLDKTGCYESLFGRISGARDRYEACRFDCGADTYGKGGLCIGLREKRSNAETVGTSKCGEKGTLRTIC